VKTEKGLTAVNGCFKWNPFSTAQHPDAHAPGAGYIGSKEGILVASPSVQTVWQQKSPRTTAWGTQLVRQDPQNAERQMNRPKYAENATLKRHRFKFPYWAWLSEAQPDPPIGFSTLFA
jgi:hypothetical protein